MITKREFIKKRKNKLLIRWKVDMMMGHLDLCSC